MNIMDNIIDHLMAISENKYMSSVKENNGINGLFEAFKEPRKFHVFRRSTGIYHGLYDLVSGARMGDDGNPELVMQEPYSAYIKYPIKYYIFINKACMSRELAIAFSFLSEISNGLSVVQHNVDTTISRVNNLKAKK